MCREAVRRWVMPEDADWSMIGMAACNACRAALRSLACKAALTFLIEVRMAVRALALRIRRCSFCRMRLVAEGLRFKVRPLSAVWFLGREISTLCDVEI